MMANASARIRVFIVEEVGKFCAACQTKRDKPLGVMPSLI
jgi:hypothetical protein